MPTLNFSFISDDVARTSLLSEVIRNFEQKSNIKINKQVLSWANAWQKMLDFSRSNDKPDISHIGSSWSNSLSAMNVLRPFTKDDISNFGGSNAFFRTARKSAYTSSGKTVWAIPWSTFTYILVYRRDLIAKAGLEEFKAFDTAKSLDNVLATLQAAGIKTPWAIETASTWDLIHIAASWVWGAGGNYLSADGKKVLFHKPEALAGLSDFFKLFRYLSPESQFLNAQQSFDLFRQGQCAVTIIAADSVYNLLDNKYSVSEVRANLGTAALPGSPWVGGDNLVIWKNTGLSQSHTQAALDFVRYLTKKETQVNLYQSAGILPTRVDAFNQITMNPSGLKPTLARVFNRGQTHPPYKLWGQIESELRQAFGHILDDLLGNPSAEVTPTLEKYLQPLGLKLEPMLR